MDFINLGFSGNCKGEESMVKYIASLDVSLFVCDYDHNAPTAEYLENTINNLYNVYRKAKPNVPIVLISKPNYYFRGKVDKGAKNRLKVLKSLYNEAIKKGDKNIYLIEGKNLFKQNYDLCTVDGTHPNDLGFYFMAKEIEKEIKKILGL